MRPGMDTDELMSFIRDDFDTDCQPNKKKLYNKNKSAATYEDGEVKQSAANEEEDLQQRAPPANLDQISIE